MSQSFSDESQSREWHPQVFLAMHQMSSNGPRFFVPPNYDPIDTNQDPLIWREAALLGSAMALELESQGKSGVVSNAMYDYYWPGYEDSAPLGRNTVCLLTEAASAKLARISAFGATRSACARSLASSRASLRRDSASRSASRTMRAACSSARRSRFRRRRSPAATRPRSSGRPPTCSKVPSARRRRLPGGGAEFRIDLPEAAAPVAASAPMTAAAQ